MRYNELGKDQREVQRNKKGYAIRMYECMSEDDGAEKEV